MGRLFKKDQMDYDSFDSDSFMENMMRNKMKSDDSSSYRQRMAALLSRSKRQANKGRGRKDSATTLPATLDIGDKLVEKLKHQQEEMEHKIGNMTCVLRETGVLNQQNKLDIRTQKPDHVSQPEVTCIGQAGAGDKDHDHKFPWWSPGTT